MTQRWTAWAAAASLASAGGCLASKSDIRLLQDELRVSRAEAARADSARAAQADTLRRQLVVSQDKLAAFQEQTRQFFGEADRNERVLMDSLVAVAGRFGTSQANAGEMLAHIEGTVLHIFEQGQANSAQFAQVRQFFESDTLRNSAAANGGTAPGLPGDSTRSGQARSDVPAPASLFQLAREALDKNAFSVARGEYDTYIQTYPNSPEAKTAQLAVASTFASEGNQVAADSVYTLIVAKYPKTDEASTALFKHGKSLCNAGNPDAARKLFQQIVSDGPTWATVYPDAVSALKQSNPCS